MASSQITLTRLDGSELSFDTRSFMCLADRVAFERHFGSSSAGLAKMRDKFNPDGTPVKGADLSDLQEEHVAFLVWRAILRYQAANDPGAPLQSFDDFVEGLEEFDVKDGVDDVDPTVSPNGSSPESLSSSV